MHICISNIIKSELGLTDKFVYGSILPDNIKYVTGERDKTRYIESKIIDGESRELPNIMLAIKALDIKDREIKLGYIAHLVEDYVWFNNYIPKYAKVLDINKIQYLKDGSIHTTEEYSKAMYADYFNVTGYIMGNYGNTIANLIEDLPRMTDNGKYKEALLVNTKYENSTDLSKNTFITKEDVDKYIEECVKSVKKIIVELMGE